MSAEPNTVISRPSIEGWSYKKLIDCTSDGKLSYGIVQPGSHDENGIPIIRVNNVNNGQLRLNDVLRVSVAIEGKYRRTRLKGGEVLLTLVGSTGQSVVAPKELSGWNIARAIAVIRPRPEIGAHWINICLQTKEVQQFLNERANTTVQKTLNLGDVRELPIPIPPQKIKKQIEEIAISLVNKIELNRQINQTLEQMAQAIFKSWFVDFDPVHAKVLAIKEGRDPIEAAARVIGNPALKQIGTSLREIAELLPSEFVESELGLIPKGWEVSQIGEEVTIFGGGTPSTKNPDFWQQGEFYWATPRDLSNLSDKILQETERKISRLGVGKISSGQLPKGTVLMSSRAPVGYLALADTPISINQGFIAMVADKSLPNHYVLQWAEATMEEIKNRASGTTFAEISKKSFRTISVIVPSEKILNSYDFTLSNIYGGIRTKLSEIKTLTLLRDTLLPKLLSGEIRVGDVEQQVREVQ